MTNPTVQISSCEVCGSSTLDPVLNLGSHPMCDDLVPVGDTRTCLEYPIEILYCRKCATAHQRFQVPKRDLFPPTYHYRSRFTGDVMQGMAGLVECCERRLGSLADRLVLDVGCNDGSLLDSFAQRGCRTIGVEPTGAWTDADGKGHAIYNTFFDAECAERILREHGRPWLITFTNVFAHIENLPELLRALRVLLATDTTLVIENHYLGAVLARYQFDTFYHEHPRTYSLSSFMALAKNLDARVAAAEFPSRYGGNIRVFISRSTVDADVLGSIADIVAAEQTFPDRLHALQAQVSAWKAITRERLTGLVAMHGRLQAKAFPGRAAILLKTLGLDEHAIAAVFEKPGSMKIGHYVPGTRIPILSDDDLFARPVLPPLVLNLAWHISGEIRKYLSQRGYAGRVVDILDPQEFAEQG